MNRVNECDAPDGYRAVPVDEFDPDDGNLCRNCDLFPNCNPDRLTIDRFPAGHNCRGHELIGSDGNVYVRADRRTVVFKKGRS